MVAAQLELPVQPEERAHEQRNQAEPGRTERGRHKVVKLTKSWRNRADGRSAQGQSDSKQVSKSGECASSGGGPNKG